MPSDICASAWDGLEVRATTYADCLIQLHELSADGKRWDAVEPVFNAKVSMQRDG